MGFRLYFICRRLRVCWRRVSSDLIVGGRAGRNSNVGIEVYMDRQLSIRVGCNFLS